MYCQFCGSAMSTETEFCAQCGKQAPSAGASAAGSIGSQIKASSKDAASVLKQLLKDPVGGLAVAYATLGNQRAMSAGLVLCLAFALAAAGGITMGAGRWFGQLYRLTGGAMSGPGSFSGFLQLALQFFVIPAAIAAVGYGIRRVVGASPPLAADVFTAGAALAPLGLATLLAGLLGVGNLEVILVLILVAVSYLVLMLFSGFTRAGGMTETAGAPAVPVSILLAGWLASVVFRAMW